VTFNDFFDYLTKFVIIVIIVIVVLCLSENPYHILDRVGLHNETKELEQAQAQAQADSELQSWYDRGYEDGYNGTYAEYLANDNLMHKNSFGTSYKSVKYMNGFKDGYTEKYAVVGAKNASIVGNKSVIIN
jgi:hypothetical protein